MQVYIGLTIDEFLILTTTCYLDFAFVVYIHLPGKPAQPFPPFRPPFYYTHCFQRDTCVNCITSNPVKYSISACSLDVFSWIGFQKV